MATFSDIDLKNPNKICGIDWGLIPIPKNYDELAALYGDPYRDKRFEQKYIIRLPHKLSSGKEIVVASHICMVTALHDLFANHGDCVHDYGGCFNIREVRGVANSKSIHSWGMAIDLNVDANPLGSSSKANQPKELIDCLTSHGFFWGANYHGRKDPMHFQRTGGF